LRDVRVPCACRIEMSFDAHTSRKDSHGDKEAIRMPPTRMTKCHLVIASKHRFSSSTIANTFIKLNDNTTILLLGFGIGTAHFRKDAQESVAAAIKAGFTHAL